MKVAFGMYLGTLVLQNCSLYVMKPVLATKLD